MCRCVSVDDDGNESDAKGQRGVMGVVCLSTLVQVVILSLESRLELLVVH